MFFDRSLRNVTEIIVLEERMSTVKIDQFGNFAKNVWAFAFVYYFIYFVGTFVGLNSLSSCCSLHQNNKLMDVNGGRLTSNIFFYIPLLIFLGLFIIIVLFYHSTQEDTVDKIKKPKIVASLNRTKVFNLIALSGIIVQTMLVR